MGLLWGLFSLSLWQLLLPKGASQGGGGLCVTRVPHAPSWRCGCTSGVIWVQRHRFVSAMAMCAQNRFKINQNPVLALAIPQRAPAAAQLKIWIIKPKPFYVCWDLSPQSPDYAEQYWLQCHRVLQMEKNGDGTVRLEGVETVPGFRALPGSLEDFHLFKNLLGLSKNLLHSGSCCVSQIKYPASHN